MNSNFRLYKTGFTFIELMLSMLIIAILAGIAYPAYRGYKEDMEIATATLDIREIEGLLERSLIESGSLPDNLNGLGPATDPWGNPYQFLNFSNVNGNGQKRKDRNLVPLNTDYDLYSKGPDGRSVSPLTAMHSRDDIIRANNGGYIGAAEGY